MILFSLIYALTHQYIRIPLHHFPCSFQILTMIIGSTNGIFIFMHQLSFNPSAVKPFFMQDRTHGVAETMPRGFTIIPHSF